MKKFVGLVHEKKGQTGLEFLLIIAGVLIVVGVVGYTLKSTVSAAGDTVTDNQNIDETSSGSPTSPSPQTPTDVAPVIEKLTLYNETYDRELSSGDSFPVWDSWVVNLESLDSSNNITSWVINVSVNGASGPLCSGAVQNSGSVDTYPSPEPCRFEMDDMFEPDKSWAMVVTATVTDSASQSTSSESTFYYNGNGPGIPPN